MNPLKDQGRYGESGYGKPILDSTQGFGIIY